MAFPQALLTLLPALVVILLLPVAFAGLADPGGHTTFVHDNSSLHYSDFASVEVGCVAAPTSQACRNKWWVAENEGDFATVIQGMHSTAGPSSSMSFTFTGSAVVWLRGRRDADVELQSTVNGVAIARPVESTPATFSLLIDGLNPQSINTFEVSYAAGSGILSVVVVFLDANGRAVDPPHDEDPPESTQPPTSELSSTESTTSSNSVTTVSKLSTNTLPANQTESTASSQTVAANGDAPQTSQVTSNGNSRRLVLILSILATALGLLAIAAGLFFWRWRRRRRRLRQGTDFSPLFISSRDAEGSVSDPPSPVVEIARPSRRSKQLLRRDVIQLREIDMSPPSYESVTATRNSTVVLSDD